MTKYLTLILLISLAWGQNESDTLILADGSVSSGKYLGIIFGGIKFETTDKNILKPPILSVQKLSINTFTIIKNGKWVVEKDFVKISEGSINQQSYYNYQRGIAIEKLGLEWSDATTMSLEKLEVLYQQDYQQGIAAAKKDWVDSQRFYGILSPSKNSLQLKERNQILVTDFRPPVPGFRDGYRKEMAKLKFKQDVKFLSLVVCGCLGMWSWLMAGWAH